MKGWRDTATDAAKLLQSCPTLCDPIDGSPPGSPIPGILQARTLEWVAIFFSNARKWKVKVKSLSHVRLFMTPWTAAHQAPPICGIFQARVLEWVDIAFSRRYTTTWQIPATKKKKKWLFILMSKLFQPIPIGQLKIKVVIYSCHHLLKGLQQKEEKGKPWSLL